MKYKHVFFDLDHTLWDFERNSAESLEEIFTESKLEQYGIESSQVFIQSFLRINTQLWDAFDRGNLHHSYIRSNRFRLVFEELGSACPENHVEMNEIYLRILPVKKHLLDGAIEILQHLQEKGYVLHVITNGFNEIQAIKMSSSGISHFFSNVVTFESANAKKPDPQIFQHALDLANASREESIMIGDNWFADIMGAKKAGLDTVYLNPARLKFDDLPTYEIQRLEELRLIL